MEIGKLIIIFFGAYAAYLLVGGLLMFLLYNWRKHISLALQMVVSAILSRGILTELIRFLWPRSRPFVEQNFVPLIPHTDSASFPSGHATFFFAIGTVLYVYNKKAGVLFLLLSSLIGIARVFAGLHWISDIVGGAVIGVVSGLFVIRLTQLMWKR